MPHRQKGQLNWATCSYISSQNRAAWRAKCRCRRGKERSRRASATLSSQTAFTEGSIALSGPNLLHAVDMIATGGAVQRLGMDCCIMCEYHYEVRFWRGCRRMRSGAKRCEADVKRCEGDAKLGAGIGTPWRAVPNVTCATRCDQPCWPVLRENYVFGGTVCTLVLFLFSTCTFPIQSVSSLTASLDLRCGIVARFWK